VEGATIVLYVRDNGERRGGDGKEKSMTMWLVGMLREFNT
jgi:hypothetical protein